MLLLEFVQLRLDLHVVIQALFAFLDCVRHVRQGQCQALGRVQDRLGGDLIEQIGLFGNVLSGEFPIVDQLRYADGGRCGGRVLVVVVIEKGTAREIVQQLQLTTGEIIEGLVLFDQIAS